MLGVLGDKALSTFAIVGDYDAALVDAMLGKPALASYAATVEQLDAAGVQLVLAFGSRAANALVPEFRSMALDRGKAVLGASGKWMVMAMRDKDAPITETILELGRVETLLLTEGLVELCQPAPPRGWPDAIAFLLFAGERKTGKCMLCGGDGIAAYTGEGLTWKLCERHAWQSSDWAVEHLPAMREHAYIAMTGAAIKKRERKAEKMQAELSRQRG